MKTAIITVYQTEFEGKEGVSSSLSSMCSEVKDIGGACIYHPSPGNLVTAIRLLQENAINYGIHFPRSFLRNERAMAAPDNESAY